MPTSALNRHSVRLVESARIDPGLLFATLTGTDAPLEAVGATAVAVPLPPHTEMARATRGITASLARTVKGVLRVMSLF